MRIKNLSVYRQNSNQEIVAIKKGKEPYSIAQLEAVKALQAFAES